MIPAETLATIALLGLSKDQAQAVASMLLSVENATREELGIKKRSSAALRQERYRNRKASQNVTEHNETVTGVTSQNVTEASQPITNVTPPRAPIRERVHDGSLEEEVKKDSSLHSLSSREIENLAEQFYRAYPKHVDPRSAKTKFLSVVKSGEDPRRLIEAAEKFRKAHDIAGTDKQYIPAPAVWLNKGGYDSEDLPQPRTNGNSHEPRKRTVYDAARDLHERSLNGEVVGFGPEPEPITLRVLQGNGAGSPTRRLLPQGGS